MSSITIDAATAERMGYEDAIAAVTIPAGNILMEFALLAPGQPLSGNEWVVVVHSDCDPDRPDRGVSSVEPCGTDRLAAEAYYASRVDETINEIESDIMGRKNGF